LKTFTQPSPQYGKETEYKIKNRKMRMPKIDSEKFYFIGEVAQILRCSVSTMRNRIKNKEIEYYYDGQYKISGKAILEYLEKHHHPLPESDNI